MYEPCRTADSTANLVRVKLEVFSSVHFKTLVSINREFKLHVLTANGKHQNGADSAYFFSN